MSWFLGKLVFRIHTPEGGHQFDEQLRLIQAENYTEAFLKAKSIGLREEECLPASRATIAWEFINIAELISVELADGHQIYTLTQEPEEDKSYISCVHRKAMTIRDLLVEA